MSFFLSVITKRIVNTSTCYQHELLSYLVVKVYDPAIDLFCDVYKSYGQNIANEHLIKQLAAGRCAVIEYRTLTMV